jgi:general nucleoside transport system ATP-binding protein
MVFQHFSLFVAVSVAENVTLGMEAPPRPRDLARRIRAVSEEYGLALDPHRLVGDLPVGQRQRVEVVRCLLQNPRLLIMDEPTSVLTPQEVAALFGTLRRLAAEGRAILYVSHKLDEIRALCDRATVLRGGRVVATCAPGAETARSLAEMMIGERLANPIGHDFQPGEVRLAARGLDLPSDDPHGASLRDVSFDLREGEVLGVAGVAGSGQEELLAALSGERRTRRDAIHIGARPVGAFRAERPPTPPPPHGAGRAARARRGAGSHPGGESAPVRPRAPQPHPSRLSPLRPDRGLRP